MIRVIFCLLLFVSPLVQLFSQARDTFPEGNREFLNVFTDYVTASKVNTVDELVREFNTMARGGVLSPDELTQIRELSNLMLERRLSARPYFTKYLEDLITIRNLENGAQKLGEWQGILRAILVDEENYSSSSYLDFLNFSKEFYADRAFHSSSSGVSWLIDGWKYEMKYESGKPLILFGELNLIGTRREDSILIYNTGGYYEPLEGIWHGKGGRVTWERVGLDPDVFVELGPYEIETKKSIYRVDTATLQYPVFFGAKKIQGKFEDKLTSRSNNVLGSYPRFESFENQLEVNNFGKGVFYRGGFRLHGTTIYGFGSRDENAQIKVFNASGDLAFQGSSELFTIKQEERILGERVNCTVYLEKDSLHHPSVNLRFEVEDNILELSRGEKGSDRNPFYSSVHQVNIDAEELNYYMDQDSILIGERRIGFSKRVTPVVFESLKYFEISDYNRIQNIADINPIAVIKAIAEKEDTLFLNANYLAERIDSRFTVDNIKTLLYDLVSKGFISYDSEREIVEVKDKIFHYANASREKVDFDLLRITSEYDNTNAVFNIKDRTILAEGVSNIEFSRPRRVAIQPLAGRVKIKENRDMDFDGKLYAGYSTLIGKDFHFEYDKFQIAMDSVRYFDLFLLTDSLDRKGQPTAKSIGSRIEHLQGFLLIDAPSNKSGRQDIPMFPSFQSKKDSYVFYDDYSIEKGVYNRDSFYFELLPFSFNSLDDFGKEDLQFKGRMYSAGIFPDFDETLVLMEEDQSLGFVSPTPTDGYDNYGGKGNFNGDIYLSNKGFNGKGVLSYLGAVLESDDIIFRPKQLVGTADQFDLEEDRSAQIEVPKAFGTEVAIDWRPYKDSMYITSTEQTPFELFRAEDHYLAGVLILTPGGLKGDGTFGWTSAEMESDLFSFGANSTTADTTSIRIRAFDPDIFALVTKNLHGRADFDEQRARFETNDEFMSVDLPHNRYLTTADAFDWDMENKKISFEILEGVQGRFLSTDPQRDSLNFIGKTATFDLKNSNLDIGGVESIISADAFVYPEDGKILIKPGGDMDTLYNARIVADTLTQFHVINRATVHIDGRKDFEATGFYEYNVGPHKQEIEFTNITGGRIGKGARSEKRVATRATGEVTPRDNFYIDDKTEFRGIIRLSSETRNLEFQGFARLEGNIETRHWFSVNFEGDRDNLNIAFNEPKNYEGESLLAGIFLSKETARIYPRVLAPLFFRKDRPILPVTGLLTYDEDRDRFILGDSAKVVNPDVLNGNMMVFHNKTGKIDLEGRFNFCSELTNLRVDVAGVATTEQGVTQDSLNGGPMTDKLVSGDFMLGLDLLLPDDLMKLLKRDFTSGDLGSFDGGQSAVYATDITFYKKVIAELFDINDVTIREALNGLALNRLDLPRRANTYDFLLSRVPMKWDPDYQSFVSTESKIAIASVDGEMVNKKLDCYVECKMPQAANDDRLYLYVKGRSGSYYFFGYQKGVLSIVSNNTEFNDAVINMKDKDRIIKTKEGINLEIQPVNPGTATAFVNRVLAVMD